MPDFWGTHHEKLEEPDFTILRYVKNTIKTLKIGTPRLTTIVVLNIKQFDFTMPPKDKDKLANSEEPDQTALKEQSDQDIHCLLRHICPNI